jgi:uncharacterized protein (DUF1810 family)
MPGHDPHNLTRLVEAQRPSYDRALAEIVGGHKRSHWMWYIFPQLEGLGSSAMARAYAIRSLAAAEAYLRRSILRPRLLACAAAALAVEGRTAREIFGSPDDLKLRSCATLLAQVSPAGSVFHRVLTRYFAGEPDATTLRGLGGTPGS